MSAFRCISVDCGQSLDSVTGLFTHLFSSDECRLSIFDKAQLLACFMQPLRVSPNTPHSEDPGSSQSATRSDPPSQSAPEETATGQGSQSEDNGEESGVSAELNWSGDFEAVEDVSAEESAPMALEPTSDLTCPHCSTDFSHPNALWHHIVSCSSKRADVLHCPHCGFFTKKRTSMDIHSKSSRKCVIFKLKAWNRECRYCQRVEPNGAGALYSHLRCSKRCRVSFLGDDILGSGAVRCPECGGGESGLEAHLRESGCLSFASLCSVDEALSCDACDYRTWSPATLASHWDKRHTHSSNESLVNVPNYHTKKMIDIKQELAASNWKLELKEPALSRQPCPTCGKTFARRDHMLRHARNICPNRSSTIEQTA